MAAPAINLPTPVRAVVRSKHRARRVGPGALAAPLGDGRLHLQHGPIDLIIDASGDFAAVCAAYEAACSRFTTILPELIDELPQLRAPVGDTSDVHGTTARRMRNAAALFTDRFITPMAAVAGAVADEILTTMRAVANLNRLYVNNGGDIALWLDDQEEMRLGVVAHFDRPQSPNAPAVARVTARSGVRGIATSGWRGRSHSLGVADAVTVFADNAATADAAATLIANAVIIDSEKVIRQPAVERDIDSDLGGRLVTVDVGELSVEEARRALAGGVRCARSMLTRCYIVAAIIFVQGHFARVGNLSS